jgi:Xaa-Pro aminopeptidase
MISLQEYAERRKKFMKHLSPDSIVILHAAPVKLRTESAEYPYRQDNNFVYLCGFPEPHATLVLTHDKSILFCQQKDPSKEIWTGRIIGPEQAKRDYGLDEVRSNQNLEGELDKLRAGKKDQTEEMLHHISEMRLIKSEAEIDLMRKAASISAQAHKKAMQSIKQVKTEYELAALYEYEFKIHGANGLAYESIVGGGGNACILHYRENNAPLRLEDLVLVDAACEYGLYAADITRTFPVDGTFSTVQRDVYQVVLNAQVNAINLVKPGITWESVNHQVEADLTEGLIDLELLTGTKEQLIEQKAYRRFYMHSCGHWLGLDVHDVGSYKKDNQPRKLEKHMVVTVEPGIYIAPADDIPKHFHNIGIRIEDDVLVTAKGSEVLSFEAPKAIDAIESCCAN